MTDTIKEFLVSVSYNVDDESRRGFLQSITTASKRMLEFGTIVKTAQLAFVSAMYDFSVKLDKLYWQSRQMGTSIATLRAIEFAAKQTGGNVDAMTSAVANFRAQMIHIGPGAETFMESYLPPGKLRERMAATNDYFEKLMILAEGTKVSRPDERERIAVMQMFGVDFPLLEQMDRMGPALREEHERQKKLGLDKDAPPSGLVQEVNRTKQIVEDILNKVAENVSPILTRQAVAINHWLLTHSKQISGFLTSMSDGFATIARWATAAAVAVHKFATAVNITGGTPDQKARADMLGELKGAMDHAYEAVKGLARAFRPLFEFFGLIQVQKGTGDPALQGEEKGGVAGSSGAGNAGGAGTSPSGGGGGGGTWDKIKSTASNVVNSVRRAITGGDSGSSGSSSGGSSGSVVRQGGASSDAGNFGTNRGVINRNPYNIMAGSFARSQGSTGSAGWDVNHGVAVFPSFQSGEAAAETSLLNKYRSGRNTLWKLIAAKGGWTPGNLGPVSVGNVGRIMGVGPHDPINLHEPKTRRLFMDALMEQELGPAAARHVRSRMGRVPKADDTPTPKPSFPKRSQFFDLKGPISQPTNGGNNVWKRTQIDSTSKANIQVDVTGAMDPQATATLVAAAVSKQSGKAHGVHNQKLAFGGMSLGGIEGANRDRSHDIKLASRIMPTSDSLPPNAYAPARDMPEHPKSTTPEELGWATMPAGMKNLNPPNLKYYPNVQWEGSQGPSQNIDDAGKPGAAPQNVFASPEMAFRAMSKLADTYARRGIDTVDKFGKAYTPSNPKAGRNIAEFSNMDHARKYNFNDPDVQRQLFRGVTKQEQGPAGSDAVPQSMIDAGIALNKEGQAHAGAKARAAALPNVTLSGVKAENAGDVAKE